MNKRRALLALDVGEKRIGVAIAHGDVAIAIPYDTVEVDGGELEAIAKIVYQNDVSTIVIGYPRNQSGEATKQTVFAERFASTLKDLDVRIVFQDESLTSVIAEDRLKSSKKAYSKGDIDAMAASIILTDYIERN